MMNEIRSAQTALYEVDIEIGAKADRIWRALIDETNTWWPAEYRLLASNSTLQFNTHAGGNLVETTADGRSLIWFSLQLYQPDQFAIYLVGHIAPEWGGPALSQMKLSVEADSSAPDSSRATLRVNDSLVGDVSEKTVASLVDGWQQLFGALKAYVEE